MRHLIKPIFTAVGMILSTVAANAQIAEFLADDAAADDKFGYAVSVYGIIAVVGAPGDDDKAFGAGSAYVYDITDPANITKQFKLLADDGQVQDSFGFAVANAGNIAVIGSPGDDDHGDASGSAYLFDTSSGQQLYKLLANNGMTQSGFGRAVAIHGTTTIIGAPYHGASAGGAAYIFDTTTGEQLFQLIPDDAQSNHRFGISVSIYQNIALVGAQGDNDNTGAAYLFDVTTGQQISKIVANGSQPQNFFGNNVAISGIKAVVTAIGAELAYVFDVSDPSNPVQGYTLSPDNGSAGSFGVSLGLHNNGRSAIIGDIYDDSNGFDSGAIYYFSTGTGRQEEYIRPGDGHSWDEFGTSIAVSGLWAIVGSALHDHGNIEDSGSAYLFNSGYQGGSGILNTFGVLTGMLLDGDLKDLELSDDSYIHTRSGFGDTVVDLHNLYMFVTGSVPYRAPDSIDLIIETRIDEPAGLAQIRMWNYISNNLDVVGSYSISNTDSVEVIYGLDAYKYVNSNNKTISIKIKHLVFVPFLAFTFESFIDQVKIASH